LQRAICRKQNSTKNDASALFLISSPSCIMVAPSVMVACDQTDSLDSTRQASLYRAIAAAAILEV
jgi:hypothetical protein